MKNELNKNIDCLITKSIIVKKILAFHQHMNTYKPKFWRWFAVVCGGLRWFSRFFNGTRSYRRIIVPNSGGGLWWFVVVCGGVWWFAVVCGGLWWFVVDCGGLSFSHTEINTGLCLNWSSVNRAGYIAYMNTKLDVVVGLLTLMDTAPE